MHVSTASRALDELQAHKISAATVFRVRAAAEELSYGYHRAAPRRRRRTRSVGVVVPNFENPYAGSLIRGPTRVLARHGLMPLGGEPEEDPERHADLLEHFVTRRVDGIATPASHVADRPVLLEAGQRVPVVLGVRHVPRSGLPSVFHDDERGAELAAEHLLALGRLGYRDLVQLAGPQDIDSFRRRAAGFRRAIAAAGATDLSGRSVSPAPDLEGGRELRRLALE